MTAAIDDAKALDAAQSASGPRHVAIIMDGNGRWAQLRGRPRLFGHHAGARRVREIVEACPANGVKYLTIFAFSTENWKRTQVEVSGLMKLFQRYITKEARALSEDGVRVRFIGDADARIAEDYLRILRFFRFHAWYGDQDAGIDADGIAACAAHVEGIATLSKERIGQEMRKLLSAPDPAPAVASMAATGALHQVLAGADHGALSVLVHIEQMNGLDINPMRRLAVLGGEAVSDSLRLSKVETRQLGLLTEGADTAALAYHEGADVAIDALATVQTSLENDVLTLLNEWQTN